MPTDPTELVAKPMSSEAIERFLAAPNVAVVAVIASNGSLHAVPTWYLYEHGEVVFCTPPSALKCKALIKAPRVTLCVDTKPPPYKAVVLKGRATIAQGGYCGQEEMLRMATRYQASRWVGRSP
jgi:nitroimidazol reductase NimA-like FMN-containing flavoprotein (pyridoxamine 5'-phosphate oxidase superfamily)